MKKGDDRTLRLMSTYHREQGVFMAVLEVDDEIKVIPKLDALLMKLQPGARVRVVRYLMERHVVAQQPPPATPPAAPAPCADGPSCPDADAHPKKLSEAESLAVAKAKMAEPIGSTLEADHA